jgi:hypothetical protein
LEVTLNRVENILGETEGFTWRDRFVAFLRGKDQDPDMMMNCAMMFIAAFVEQIEEDKMDSDFVLFTTSKTSKKVGSASKEVHSSCCILAWSCRMKVNEGRGYMTEFVDPEEPGAGTSYRCCQGLWTPGFTPRAFKESRFYWAAKKLWDLEMFGVDPIAEAQYQKAMEGEIFRTTEQVGFKVFKNEGVDHSNAARDRVLLTLARYGALAGDGIPAFRAITDRKKAFRADDVDPPCPLTASGRLQLYLSDEWVAKTLPKIHAWVKTSLGGRMTSWSLLYSEGVNYLRTQTSFLEELEEAGFTLPKKHQFISTKWLTKKLGEKRCKELMASLDQTAHKDVVKGPLSHVPEYMPHQMIMALRKDTSFYVWKNETGGKLQLWDDSKEWRSNELKAGYSKEEIVLNPMEGIFFHAFQTHAGAGGLANFRLFAGSVATPEGYSILSHSQSYFELEEGEAFGAYRQAAEYIGADDDHSDNIIYPGWKKNLKKWKAMRKKSESITVPPGGENFRFYEYLKSAYENSAKFGSNLDWGC